MTLWAYSIFGTETRKGLVKILRDKEIIATLAIDEARDWAAKVLQAAEAAQTDEYLMHLLTNRMGLDDGMAGAVLVEFREYREKKEAESRG